MNSRERVRCVLDGKVPDRIPNGLGACETAGLHLLAYQKLQELTGQQHKPAKLDTFMLNAVFEPDVIQAIDGDMILLASPRMCQARFRGKDHEREWRDQILWGKKFRVAIQEEFITNPDGSMIWQSAGGLHCPAGGFYFDSAQASDFSLDYEIPSPDDFHPAADLPEDWLRSLEESARMLYEETELSICCGETIDDLQIAPAGYIGTMMLMRQEPAIMDEFLAKAVTAALAQLRQLDQAIGKFVDVLSIAHDFGDNRGVTIGGDLWREIYKPHYQKLFQEWKKISRMKINLHTCGSIVEILPDLIECGADIYNPVQTSANGMSAQALKDQFGQKIIFYGGAYDAQLIPHDADYAAVYEQVRRSCQVFKKSGRYIFAGVHNLPGDLPGHHLAAMLDAYQDSRNY